MRYLFTILASAGILFASAQQTSNYSQFNLNAYRFNPAFAGQKSCFDLKMGTRFQWMGFEGAPSTQFVSFNTPIVPKNKPTQRHGAGIFIEQDRTHITKRNRYLLSYAYHLRVHRDIKLSFGMHAGVIEYVVSNVLPDPALSGKTTDFHYPEIFPGLLLYNKKFYIGASAEHLYPLKIKVLDPPNKLKPHVIMMAGKRQETNYNFDLYYSALFKWTTITPPMFHANVQWEYSDKFILGLGYRAGEAVVGMVKFKLADFITIGYAVDFPLNAKRIGIFEGHEGIIGLSRCGYSEPLPKLDCPAYQ